MEGEVMDDRSEADDRGFRFRRLLQQGSVSMGWGGRVAVGRVLGHSSDVSRLFFTVILVLKPV